MIDQLITKSTVDDCWLRYQLVNHMYCISNNFWDVIDFKDYIAIFLENINFAMFLWNISKTHFSFETYQFTKELY